MQSGLQFKIGLLNDLHYDGGVQALNRLYESVTALNAGQVQELLVLGDLIDSTGESNALRLLREVSALCDAFHGTVRYMPGNHDLDHITKPQFYNALGCAGDAATRSFAVADCTCICLDGNFSPDGTEYAAGNFEWEAAFVPEEQLAWLQQIIASAGEPVLLFSHQRLDIPGEFAVANHDAVRKVIRDSGKVKAVFQGHQHADDLRQVGGTVYYTLAAHKDDAGPGLIHRDARGIRLIRDYRSESPVEAASAPVTTS
jgi:UDP-2,3-diacylglucosamine pyrophosphatase LpxH